VVDVRSEVEFGICSLPGSISEWGERENKRDLVHTLLTESHTSRSTTGRSAKRSINSAHKPHANVFP
jgi:hypothetical protein